VKNSYMTLELDIAC